jgi:hypothetical protein
MTHESIAAGAESPLAASAFAAPAPPAAEAHPAERASWLHLTMLAGAGFLALAWLLFSPERMVSRLMTWDLLFNLEGAWRVLAGQTPHVDFHDPLGTLAFWPSAIGMLILGPTVFACILGKLLAGAVTFVAASFAAARRLTLLPAALFVLFACSLVLIPTNTGSMVDHFSFAMTYNAMCWAALSILALIVYLPPARRGPGDWPADWPADWIDPALGALLLLAMFYLKITFFLVGIVAVAGALVVSPHLRARRLAWTAVACAALANAAAPWNWPYLADIFGAVRSGAVRDDVAGLAFLAAANVTELALHGVTLLAALALWRARLAPAQLPAAVGVLLVCAATAFSQNAQLRGLPLACVAAFLLHAQLRNILRRSGHGGATVMLLAALIYPIAHVGAAVFSIASYHAAAASDSGAIVVGRTNLRGLALPRSQSDAVAHQEVDYDWIANLRPIGGGVRVSQAAYVDSLLEAAALFGPASGRSGGIQLLDQVNPMAFVLGRPAPRGVALWMDLEFPFQPAATSFAEVSHVLIPKLSTYAELTAAAVAHYGGYLAAHFPDRTETRHWVLLSRSAPRL